MAPQQESSIQRNLPLISTMDEDGREKKTATRKGGFRTVPFILGNEICDRFAMAGYYGNMVSYLTSQLHMPLVDASNTLTNLAGTASITPILGALVADSFAGRFYTIVGGSILYQLGIISLAISAILPSLHPPPCPPSGTCQRASTGQLLILYLSLFITTLGSGGIRPNVVTFGADQYDINRPKPKWSFFNLYFFSMNLAVLLALTVVVYIQDNVGWGWGFGIPWIAMFFALVFFVVGCPFYIRMKPAGSPLTRLSQVVVAAIRKRRLERPTDSTLLYKNRELDADISTTGDLIHTDQLRFFDRAAISTGNDNEMTISDEDKPNLWRLSTVHRVEELKSIIRMLPIWSIGILLTAAASHNNTLVIWQAKTMDRHLSSDFQIPAATMTVFSVIALLVSLAIYDRVFVPITRRYTGRPTGITYLQRMGIGLVIQIVANAAAAMVETKRKEVAVENGLVDEKGAVVPFSVFWLVPQYVIHGLADTFSLVGNLEFLYDQAPESMRSTGMSLFWLSASIGNYVGTALVILVNDCTKGVWLQDNINKGKLDYYYWLVTILQVFNLACFLLCAKFYRFKPLQLAGAENPSKSEEVCDGSADGEEGHGGNVHVPEGDK